MSTSTSSALNWKGEINDSHYNVMTYIDNETEGVIESMCIEVANVIRSESLYIPTKTVEEILLPFYLSDCLAVVQYSKRVYVWYKTEKFEYIQRLLNLIHFRKGGR